MTAFVDFSQVWLAYNDSLLAQGHFAVEDINLLVDEGEFIAIVGPKAAAVLQLRHQASIVTGSSHAAQSWQLKLAGEINRRLVQGRSDSLLPFIPGRPTGSFDCFAAGQHCAARDAETRRRQGTEPMLPSGGRAELPRHSGEPLHQKVQQGTHCGRQMPA